MSTNLLLTRCLSLSSPILSCGKYIGGAAQRDLIFQLNLNFSRALHLPAVKSSYFKSQPRSQKVKELVPKFKIKIIIHQSIRETVHAHMCTCYSHMCHSAHMCEYDNWKFEDIWKKNSWGKFKLLYLIKELKLKLLKIQLILR